MGCPIFGQETGTAEASNSVALNRAAEYGNQANLYVQRGDLDWAEQRHSQRGRFKNTSR